jgi:hypothetical protein
LLIVSYSLAVIIRARADHSRAVAASARAGKGVCQGAALPVSARQKLEQVFDKRPSNKCFEQMFRTVFGSFPEYFQPNPDRIFCFFLRESNRILTEF